MAGNINWPNKLRQYMERSLFSPLAAKRRRTPWAIRNRIIEHPFGKRRCFEAVQCTSAGKVSTAGVGGIPVRRHKHTRLLDGA